MSETRFEPFVFKQSISMVKSTGKRARNLRELRELIAVISEESRKKLLNVIETSLEQFPEPREVMPGEIQWVPSFCDA